jgi:hypothetical protein
MVRKKNGKWKMCTYFTDLNKCCSKDDFPLVGIDQIVDSVAGCDIIALLDYFSGYHQIWLRKEDEEMTSFITVGRNILCYVYDIIVARKKKASYIFDLTKTFANMREAKLKLNLEKCVFRVT